MTGRFAGGLRIQPSLATGMHASEASAGAAAAARSRSRARRFMRIIVNPCKFEVRTAMPQLVETIDHGPIRELRLARPPVNALDPVLSGELAAAVAAACVPGSRVAGLVLSGGPKVFSAGLDVPYLVSLGADRDALRAAWEAFFLAARAIARAPIPVVAALAGHAPAGGCVLALCCDYRVMASGPYAIGLNETQVGLVAPEGIQHLMR